MWTILIWILFEKVKRGLLGMKRLEMENIVSLLRYLYLIIIFRLDIKYSSELISAAEIKFKEQ